MERAVTQMPLKLMSVQNAKSVAGMWIFTILWCAIAFTVFGAAAFQARNLVGGLIGGVFSLMGLVMIYASIKATLEYIKYGKVQLTLARPAETGGKLEARLDLPADLPANARISAELACVQVVWSRGSKGGTSTRERDDWTAKETFTVRRGATRSDAVLALAFPADRPPSTVPDEGPADAMFQATHPGGGVELDRSYYRWEVRVKADVPGVDLERTFRLRVAPGSGATWAPMPEPATPRVPLDRALERRLDERRAIERKLSAACFVIGIAPFLVPFVIAGLGVGLAGCPMGWSDAAPPKCELAGINWGALMAGTFDLISVAVPAGIAVSTVLYLAGQVWLNRSYSNRKAPKTRR
jgi:hypothetical protein